MEEKKENKNCCDVVEESCKGKSCCCMKACCFVKKNKLVRIVIIVLALLVAFSLGVQYGEIKSFDNDDYGFHKKGMRMNKKMQDDDYMKMENKKNNTPSENELEVKEIKEEIE